MKIPSFAVIVTLLVCLTAARALAADKADQDLHTEIIGIWRIMSFLDDNQEKIGRLGGEGKDKDGKLIEFPKLIVTADKCAILDSRGRRPANNNITNVGWDKYTIVKGSSPAAIDVSAPGRDGQSIVYPAIVKIEGGRLLIAYAESKPFDRPTEFKSDGTDNLFICERLSEKPEEIPELPKPRE